MEKQDSLLQNRTTFKNRNAGKTELPALPDIDNADSRKSEIFILNKTEWYNWATVKNPLSPFIIVESCKTRVTSMQ